MSLHDIIGQKKVKHILQNAIAQNRVHHAYLFYGNRGVGKIPLAFEFTKALFCDVNPQAGCDQCSNCTRIKKLSHPDIIYIYPASTTLKPEEEKQIFASITENPYHRLQLWSNPIISINRIRDLKRKVALKSFEGRGRVVIIADAHKMTIEAANSLLKILEEPPDKMHFILETSSINQLPQTIISRCQPVGFASLSQQDIETALKEREKLEPAKARLIARIAFGNYHRALEMIEEDLLAQREQAIDILRKILLNDFERLVLAESLVKEHEKLQIKELLSLLLIWFRDALIFTEFTDDSELSRTEREQKLVNIDEVGTLEKFVGVFESIDYSEIIIEIEKAIGLINQNVNVTFILIVLFEKLKKSMKIKRHADVRKN